MANHGNGKMIRYCEFEKQKLCTLPGHALPECNYYNKWRCTAASFYREHGHLDYDNLIRLDSEDIIHSRFEILDI